MNEQITFENLIDLDVDCGLIIGNFDGVHLGHQQLIQNFKKKCEEKRLKTVLLTFSPHPMIYFNDDGFRHLIQSPEEKIQKLEKQELDFFVEMQFCQKVQLMSSEEFICECLLKIKSLKLIHLGHDFKLGKGKKDAVKILKESVERLKKDISISIEKPFMLNQEIVSSTKIRHNIQYNVVEASKMLGYPVTISGVIESGKGIGKTKLFPTANIEVPENKLIPKPGVYITLIRHNNITYEGITNIGVNPTISSSNKITVESFIFEFDMNIYGEKIKLDFYKKLRDEIKFSDIDSLKEQISNDIQYAKDWFLENRNLRLALIGKNISHSKSQAIYEQLLGQSIDYDLIDCTTEKNLPLITDLSRKYLGVSITSPYKKSYMEELETKLPHLEAINAISFEGGKSTATNTDYLAIKDIVNDYFNKKVDTFYILGDGVMSGITQQVLNEFNVDYQILSRKNKKIQNTHEVFLDKNDTTLVINTCARDYTFKKPLKGSYHFWDMNYGLKTHTQLFDGTEVKYLDGMSLLLLQAKYALSFWNLKTY